MDILKRLAKVGVPAVLILLVAAIACEPIDQQPVNQDEIRQAVQDEVRFQMEAAKEEMFQNAGPDQGDFEFAMSEPMNELRFEFDDLRNQLEGRDYASKFDLDSLSLDIQEVWSSINQRSGFRVCQARGPQRDPIPDGRCQELDRVQQLRVGPRDRLGPAKI